MGKVTPICKNCRWAVELPWLKKRVYCRVFKSLVKKMAQACKFFKPKQVATYERPT